MAQKLENSRLRQKRHLPVVQTPTGCQCFYVVVSIGKTSYYLCIWLILGSPKLAVFCNCFELLKTVTMKEPDFGSKELYYICHLLQTTLESGIDVGRGINVESGKFGKKNNKKVQTYVEKIVKLGNS